MGYYLRTQQGLKGPVDVDFIRKLVDAGKLRQESTVVNETQERVSVAHVLQVSRVEEPQAAVAEELPPLESPVRKKASRRAAPRRSPSRGAPRRQAKPSRDAGPVRSARQKPRAPQKSRLGWTLVSLRISVVIYALLGLGMLWMMADAGETAFGLILSLSGLLPAFGVELVCRGLKRRSQRAWKFANGVSTLYLTSPFLPLAIFSFIGLHDERTVEEFGLKEGPAKAKQQRHDDEEWEEVDPSEFEE